MALFSQGNLEAVNNKIRLCTKCHHTLIFSEQDGFCCPICHRMLAATRRSRQDLHAPCRSLPGRGGSLQR